MTVAELLARPLDLAWLPNDANELDELLAAAQDLCTNTSPTSAREPAVFEFVLALRWPRLNLEPALPAKSPPSWPPPASPAREFQGEP